MRALTWPMGFIIVAKNRQMLFIASDVAWTCLNISLTLLCVDSFGVTGAGMAFFGSYLFHLLLIYPIVRHLSGFRWSLQNVQVAIINLVVLILVFCGSYFIEPMPLMALGAVAVTLSGFYSARTLVTLVSWAQIPRRLRFILVWLRMGPPATAGSRVV